MSANTAVGSWPSVDEYTEATDKLAGAYDSLEAIRNALELLLDVDIGPSLRHEAPRPHLNDVARLSLFWARADLQLDAIKDELGRITRLRDSLLLDVELDGTVDA
jgi:hypothetical protein